MNDGLHGLVVRLLLVLLLGGGCAHGSAPPSPATFDPRAWGKDVVAIGWIGHATVLVKVAGTTILTDPAFFDRVGVSVGGVIVGPRRIVAPALSIADLPPLDAVVVTHAHFDSLDLPSLRALPKEATLVAPTGCRSLLGDLGFRRYVEVGWGERTEVAGAAIEAVGVKHWGKRLPWEHARGYNGYVFSKAGARVLFASDTAFMRDFARFRGESPPLAAAVLGNGAYDPWIRNHADPEQVWQMFLDSGARVLVPVHWDTFRLGREPLGDAIRRLKEAAGPDVARVVVDRVGGSWTAPVERRAS